MKWKNKCFTCCYWDNHDYCNFMPISFCEKNNDYEIMHCSPFKKTCIDYHMIDISTYNDRISFLNYMNKEFPYKKGVIL